MPKSLHDMIERAVHDPEFRRQLLADPDGVILTEYYAIDSNALAQIRRVREVPPDVFDTILEIERMAGRRAG
jgi:hypothetical protein